MKSTPAIGKEIAEKKRQLYERHGGILSPTDLSREIGYANPRDAERWAAEHGVPALRMGPRKRGYEVDTLAQAIVMIRGMV